MAAVWYDQQRAGLGSELLDQVTRVLRRVEQGPEQFPIVFRDARRALLDRFPYALYFVLDHDLISVVAFLHGRQSRDERLKSR